MNYNIKIGMAKPIDAIRDQAIIDGKLADYREFWEDRAEMQEISALLHEAKRLREENGNFYWH